MKNFRAYVAGLLLIPVVAVGALFVIPGPDGTMLMNMDRLKRSYGSFGLKFSPIEKARRTYYTIRDKIEKVTAKDALTEEVKNTQTPDTHPESLPETLYKWRDESGNLHFSNQRPPKSVEFEVVERE